MAQKSKILQFLIWICRFNFGVFEVEEFKKFLRMGLILAFILGIYWTLKSLKDSLFIQLVDKMHLPYAKTISVLALIPLVILYTKLLEYTSREKMFIILSTFYGFGILCFGIVMMFVQASPAEIAARSLSFFIITKILGYAWYMFVESFGSIVIALFWAFSADTTEPRSAKQGFALVAIVGQMGGVICPYSIGGLPHRLGLNTDMFSIIILGMLTFAIIPLFLYFLKVTPNHLLVSFHGQNELERETKAKPGFLDGLKLLISHKYLIGIFTVIFIYEVIIIIFDFNFQLAAGTKYSGVALSNYLSIYSSSVNVVAVLCLLFGISNITRFLGISVALAAMPVIVGCALFSFLTIDSLAFLFFLMVGAKAIYYALNQPSLRQLYIPTTKDVRFKAQAWIEIFGSRGAQQAGSCFNMLLQPLQSTFGTLLGKAHYLKLSGIMGFPLLVLWFGVAVYLGKKFHKAIDENKTIC